MSALYLTAFPKDRIAFKALFGAIYVMETAQTVLIAIKSISLCADSIRNPENLSLDTSGVLTSLGWQDSSFVAKVALGESLILEAFGSCGSCL